MTDVAITAFVCGPSKGQCKCNCPDGPCDHDFQGMRPFPDGRGGEAVCTKCGMGAFEHSLWVGP